MLLMASWLGDALNLKQVSGGVRADGEEHWDKLPRSVVRNWPLLVWFWGDGESPGWQSQSRLSGCALTVSLPVCRAAWGWLYLLAPKGKAASSEEGNWDRCSLKILSSCPNCLALLVVALATRSHTRLSSLQSEFRECSAEPAPLCGMWKH